MSFLDNLKAMFGGSTPAQPEQAPEVPAVEDTVETEMEMPEVQEMPQEEVAPVEEETTEEPITTE